MSVSDGSRESLQVRHSDKQTTISISKTETKENETRKVVHISEHYGGAQGVVSLHKRESFKRYSLKCF
jgi:HSP20 family molecular chaperone IbpA